MPLVLHVEGPGALRCRGSETVDLVEVDVSLTIGRDDHNDLVLQDDRRTISSEHCRIERTEHGYVLADQSSNGTFINQAERAVSRGEPVPLAAGDLIRIGGFRLRVLSIQMPSALIGPEESGPSPMPPSPRPPSGRPPSGRPVWPVEDEEDLLPVSSPARESARPSVAAPWPDRPVDRDPAFGSRGTRSATQDHALPEAAVFIQPVVGRERIPDDWDIFEDAKLVGARAAETPLPEAESAPEPEGPVPEGPLPEPRSPEPPSTLPEPAPPVTDRAVAALLEACGLTPDDVPDDRLVEVMSRMGRSLRTTVASLEEILAARIVAKQEFGAERTMIGRSENNILKFGTGPDAAMRSLLMDDAVGFLPADRAVEQAFDDIKAHQVNLLAAARNALELLVDRLSPEMVGAAVSAGSLERAIPLLAKARAWDRYVALHARLESDLAGGDAGIPAEILARAYSGNGAAPPDDRHGADAERKDARHDQ